MDDGTRPPVPPGEAPTAVRVQGWAASAWQRLRIQLHYLRTFLRPDVILLEGRTDTGRPLSILRGGTRDRQTAYFLAGQVFTELRAERHLGRAWLWALPALARRNGCAFVLFRVSRRRAALARRILRYAEGSELHLPAFVGAVVDVTDRSRLLHSRDVQNDVRRIRNRGFRFTISTSKRDLETFVRDYRDPYVNGAHGFAAIGIDFPALFASCAQDRMPAPWVLLKVELDGQWVAGDLLVSGPGRAALMEVGVKDADAALVKRGAVQAAYWLSLEYLHSQGHQWVNLMHVPPFLRNGVVQYKLKFSPQLRAVRPNDGFLLLFDRDNEAARETLLREPVLATKGDRLRAVWFDLDPDAPPNRSLVPVERLTTAGVIDVERVLLDG